MKRKSRILKALAVVVALATFSVTTNGVTFSDSAGHWGNAAIDPWSNYGVLNGYPDGSFKPDASMTRAEMAQTLNALMKLEDQAATNPFKDMTSSDWFYAPVLKAVQAKYIYGYEDGTFRDAKNITRQEAMVMLARAFHIEEAATINKTFSDANTIGAWARGLVYAMVNAGIVNGVSNTRIDAGGIINRASVAMILHKAISTYAYEEGKVYTASGNGITLIAGKNITVNGTVNNMIIAAGASNSNAIIAGASISGKVWVDAKNCTIYATAAQKDKITLLGEGSKIVVDGITPTPYSGLTTGDPVPGSQVTYPYLTGTPIPVVTNTPTFTPTPEVPATYDVDITIRRVQNDKGESYPEGDPNNLVAGKYESKGLKPEALLVQVFQSTLLVNRTEIFGIFKDDNLRDALLAAVDAYFSQITWENYVDDTFGNVSGADPTLKELLKDKEATIVDVLEIKPDGQLTAVFAVDQKDGTVKYYAININIRQSEGSTPIVPEKPTNTPTPTPGPDQYRITVSIVSENDPIRRVGPYVKDPLASSNEIVAQNFAGLLMRNQKDLETMFVPGGDYLYNDYYAQSLMDAGDVFYTDDWASFVGDHFEVDTSDPFSVQVLNHLKNKDRYGAVGELKGSIRLKTSQGNGVYWYYTVFINIEKVVDNPNPDDYTITMEVTSLKDPPKTWTSDRNPSPVKSNDIVARNFAEILKNNMDDLADVFSADDPYATKAFAEAGRTAYYDTGNAWSSFIDTYFVASYGADSSTIKNYLKNKSTYDTVGEMDAKLELQTGSGNSYLVHIVTKKVIK